MQHFNSRRSTVLFFTIVLLVSGGSYSQQTKKNYDYLEGEGLEVRTKVEDLNATSDALSKHPLFATIKDEIERALVADENQNMNPTHYYGDYVYYFKPRRQTSIQRQSLNDYLAGKNNWKSVYVLPDKSGEISELACLSPKFLRCLVFLSTNGSNFDEMREIEMKDGVFVEVEEDPFSLPRSQTLTQAVWIDPNTILVRSDFGHDSLTKGSNYPRFVKRWIRGQSIDQAEIVARVGKDEKSSYPEGYISGTTHAAFAVQSKNFWENDYFYVTKDHVTKLPIPPSAEVRGVFNGHVFIFLRQDWGTHPAGSVLSISLKTIVNGGAATFEPLFTATKKNNQFRVFRFLASVEGALYACISENVSSKLFRMKMLGSRWIMEQVSLPGTSSKEPADIEVAGSNPASGDLFVTYQTFLKPQTVYRVQHNSVTLVRSNRMADGFNPDAFAVKQYFAKSQDGTRVPFFLIHPKSIEGSNGPTPTMIRVYGGFERGLYPSYSNVVNVAWLNKGGAYVVANVRGGDEAGPRWHLRAILENKQKTFDDLYAVAEKLIDLGITDVQHMGLRGGSNGGLVVGVAMTQRPDLFSAYVIETPLLDMVRYTNIGSGSSWIAEYGDPSSTPWPAAYSPLHYLLPADKITYAAPYIRTNANDSIAGPAHARKFAAKLQDLGHSFYFFESGSGGHSMGIQTKERATSHALVYTYLRKMLFD